MKHDHHQCIHRVDCRLSFRMRFLFLVIMIMIITITVQGTHQRSKYGYRPATDFQSYKTNICSTSVSIHSFKNQSINQLITTTATATQSGVIFSVAGCERGHAPRTDSINNQLCTLCVISQSPWRSGGQSKAIFGPAPNIVVSALSGYNPKL